MSVIIEFSISAADFELGRILGVDRDTVIELETLVPLGKTTVPLFWIHATSIEEFIDSINRHPAVQSASKIDTFDDRTLLKLDWEAAIDDLISGIEDGDGHILDAIGRGAVWEFEIQFPAHKRLSSFSAHCEAVGIPLTVQRVYTPSEPKGTPHEGLSDAQLEALSLAIKRGYYDIPRGCSTKDLADDLGISDQAVTERLRRAIVTLSTTTLDTLDADR
ncbi:helix-turn-helix domain-containing protein [Halonotius terrestris]|uniref:Helix-turn-helix domain-containing protein n=1 Tax=Halonotius terrestris TaxID=2487750 RepID=A0A8J8TC28_9EURY|nr:helix-turn-helix domain-containing protein [Halonotius terrestris]TQQ79315.1 helix-turn-helix domain-containing protein [Halonotius terrestris]